MLCLLLLTCKGKYFISKETEARRVFKTWPRTSTHKGQSQEANVTCSLLFLFHSQSVHFNCSVMSDSLRPHGLQHARLPCPSPTPGVCSNSCPSSWWCHPTMSSSVVLFFSCLQSFPASGSFPMSPFFASGGHSMGLSASALVLPVLPIFRTDFL